MADQDLLLQEFVGQLWSGSGTKWLDGTGESRPYGLETRLEYNEMLFHDRKVLDKIRVTTMDGFLGLPTIADARADNPSYDGETALPALLRGRSMTLAGRVETGNVRKMRDMQQALRYAFQDLVELPLYFRTGNVNNDVFIMCRAMALDCPENQPDANPFRRDFNLSLRASNPRYLSVVELGYEFEFGFTDTFTDLGYWNILAGSPTVVSGELSSPSGTSSLDANVGYQPLDVRVGAKVKTPASLTAATGSLASLKLRSFDLNNGLRASLVKTSTSGQWQLVLQKNVAGSVTGLASNTAFALTASTYYWLRAQIVGNVVTINLYTSDPYAGSPSPAQTLSYTLTGGDITTYGTGVKGNVGIVATSTSFAWLMDDYHVEPLNLNHQILSPYNAGSYYAQPRLRLWGPMTGVEITAEVILNKLGDTGFRTVQINGSIPAGDFYEYDVAKGTLRDSTGDNVFSQYDPTSRDILYPSGVTPLTITATTSSGLTPKIGSYHRHTWV